jgi:hypothetical protein
VPERTNIFQEVVAIIHEHMAGDAAVEESALLKHRVTGEDREVDVVIRSNVAGHDVIVSVEATAAGRKADAKWVEQLVKKHEDLPTSKLVLVSQAGFTDAARKQAVAENAVPLSPEDLTEADPAFVVVNALPSLWPKQLTLTPEQATLIVRRPDDTQLRVRDLQPDTVMYVEDGRPVATLGAAFNGLFEANFTALVEMIGLLNITEDIDRTFVLGIGPPWSPQVDDKDVQMYLRWEEADPPELHRIEVVEFVGKAIIRVSEMPLHHKRLGEVALRLWRGSVGRPANSDGSQRVRGRSKGDNQIPAHLRRREPAWGAPQPSTRSAPPRNYLHRHAALDRATGTSGAVPIITL